MITAGQEALLEAARLERAAIHAEPRREWINPEPVVVDVSAAADPATVAALVAEMADYAEYDQHGHAVTQLRSVS